MKKRRISTTISKKHWAILKEKLEKYGSQQKVLEAALDVLDGEGTISKLNPIQRQRMEVLDFPSLAMFPRRTIKHTLEGHWNRIAEEKVYELGLLVTTGRHVDDMGFLELLESFCDLLRTLNFFEDVQIEDKGGTCTIKLLHSEGKVYSDHFAYLNEEFFKEQGMECKTVIADNYIMHTLSPGEDTPLGTGA